MVTAQVCHLWYYVVLFYVAAFERDYCHIAICSDAEGWAPKRESARNKYVGVAPFTVSVTLLIHIVGK